MGWFQDAFMWPQLLTSSEGRDKLKNDIRYGEGVASVGSPLHGLTAGYKLHELMSPTVHINDRIHDLRKNGSSGHFSRSRDDMHHYAQDAFKENIPALVGWMGGAALGVGEGAGLLGGGGAAGGAAGGGGAAAAGEGAGLLASDAAALEAASASAAMNGGGAVNASMGMSAPAQGFNWGGAAQQGLGLLGSASQAQPQQQGSAVISPAPQQDNRAMQQRVAQQRRLQQLRAKPRKTLEEQRELQELTLQVQGQ